MAYFFFFFFNWNFIVAMSQIDVIFKISPCKQHLWAIIVMRSKTMVLSGSGLQRACLSRVAMLFPVWMVWLYAKRQGRDIETHRASCCCQWRSVSPVIRSQPAVEIHSVYICLNCIYLSICWGSTAWGKRLSVRTAAATLRENIFLHDYSEEDDWLVRLLWVWCIMWNADSL